ncbi:MAG: DUF2061 domain-containing protein [Limisphaerales bacterium]
MDAEPPNTPRSTDPSETEIIRESPLRSVLKAVSWRVLATLTTMVIAYIVIGDISDALKIGAVEVVAKMLIYYFHERAWAQIPLGTVRQWTGEKES